MITLAARINADAVAAGDLGPQYAAFLRSLSGIDDPTDGPRARSKGAAQAEFLANLIQARQAAPGNERIISVGDQGR